MDGLTKLNHRGHAVRHAFVEGEKVRLLHKWAKSDTWIKREDTPPPLDSLNQTNQTLRGLAVAARFERLATLRNRIVEEALRGEDYVLWIDSDVVKFPSSLIADLLKYDAPVVAAGVWIEGTNQFYDTYAFRDLADKFFPTSFPHVGLVEVHSVGTCYLVASRLYSEGKVRYRGGDSENVTFCQAVRQLGEKIYADFSIRVEHANLPNYGCQWH